MRRLSVAVVCGLAVACTKTEKVPDRAEQPCPWEGPSWTCSGSGPCTIPELAGSLCAVGMADNIASMNLGMETARTRARVEMAAVLKSKVDGFTRAVQDSLSKQGAGEDSVQKIGNVAQNVVESTLVGVSVPRTWFDKGNKTYFALAAVDTKTFANALKGLTEAAKLSDSMKAEIERRAESVVEDWEKERDRKKQ